MSTPFTEFDLTGPLPRGTAVLEASAGTGKTYAIAALASRLIAEGAATLGELMVVTFSRAATQELRARVRDRLDLTGRCLAGAPIPDRDELLGWLCDVAPAEREIRRRRIADALADFDTATIATMHEFCRSMLLGLGTLADQEPLPTFVEDLTDLGREAALDLYLSTYVDAAAPGLSMDDALGIAREVVLNATADVGPQGGHGRVAERVRFASGVREIVERRKRERGIYTYDDMLTGLQDALADPLHGAEARGRLAARFPFVLIDEFQDTDLVQWDIVKLAFDGTATLVLIGDPKQAIYSFRGADISSYLDAVASSQARYTLARNYRSDGRLVAALQTLLAGTALGEDEILVLPITPALTELRLTAPTPWHAPVRIRALPQAPDGELLSADAARTRINSDLVDDVAGLLASGATLRLRGGEEPVHPGDIAVIVRTNASGERILAALTGRGIPAVFTGASSVYTTAAARDWLTLLRALANPSSATIRAAALTALIGWTFPQLAQAQDSALTGLAAQVRGWARTLAADGMAALAESVMRQRDVTARVLSHAGGERILTDLRHVAQNLQATATADTGGAAALVDWLAERVADATLDAEDRSRRLETDADAVQILTIHRSKGLEFPLVYLPDAADLFLRDTDDGKSFVVHDAPLHRLLDVGGAGGPGRRDRLAQRRREDAGEELRKLYVALTRAQSQVTMWWAPTQRNLVASPLQRVLFRDPAAGAHPDPHYPHGDPHALGHLAARGIAVQNVDDRARAEPPAGPRPATEELFASSFRRTIDTVWGRTSYSGLTAGAHARGPGLSPALEVGGREDDEAAGELPADLPVADAQPEAHDGPATIVSPMADLAGGVQFGSLVHALLEHLDPTAADLTAAVREQAGRWLDRMPVPGVTADALTEALLPVLRTPLGPLAGDRRLADIAPTDRLPELDFELPLGRPERFGRLADVAQLIARHLPPDDPLVRYPDWLRAEELAGQTLRGFLTGSIDAMLRVGDPERYLIVDYKTNRLGPPGTTLVVGAYTPEAMATAMMEAHYPLQALLYAVAAHRYLRWRLPAYDPATHLGGVLYLFVRGMGGPAAVLPAGPAAGRAYGVFEWRPPAALVTDLSDLIGGLA